MLRRSRAKSGLGLAIVRDFAEMYSGASCLEDSPLGGLRVKSTGSGIRGGEAAGQFLSQEMELDPT
jgi:signal transduction histidine kinase